MEAAVDSKRFHETAALRWMRAAVFLTRGEFEIDVLRRHPERERGIR
jgi:hypothetical protein